MKKINLVLFAVIILLITSGSIFAQVTFRMRRPPLGQLKAADLWSATITNTGEAFTAYLYGSMKNNEDGEMIATGQTITFEVKKGTTNFKVSDLSKIPDVSYLSKDPKYKQSFMNTGGAPPGDYKICCELRRKDNTVAGEDCFDQKITGGDAPQLISPINEEELRIDNPVFTWMHSKAPGSNQTYTLRIVELKGSQSQDEAINKNPAFFEKEGINQQLFQYTSTAPKFEVGKKYAWMVIIGDVKSDAFSLRVIDKNNDNDVDYKIILMSPENESSIDNSYPKFSWKYSSENDTTSIYKVDIVEVVNNQNLDEAIKNNEKFYRLETNELEFNFINEEYFKKGVKYAWQVSLTRNNKFIAKSKIGTFTNYFVYENIPRISASCYCLDNANPVYFESGSFTSNVWSADAGTIYGSCMGHLTSSAIIPGRHTIIKCSDGYDPILYNADISHTVKMPMVNDGNFSARVGNSNVGAQTEAINYKFRINNSSDLTYKFSYALVVQDPKHDQPAQPTFAIWVSKVNSFPTWNNGLKYAFEKRANTTDGYWIKAPNYAANGILYKPWNCESINLAQYGFNVGDNVEVKFITKDCCLGGHFGYAYIDYYCVDETNLVPNIQIDSVFCNGKNISVDGTSSIGETDYMWCVDECTVSGTPISGTNSCSPWIAGQASTYNLSTFWNTLGKSFICGKYYLVTLKVKTNCSINPKVISKKFQIGCPSVNAGPDQLICCNKDNPGVVQIGSNQLLPIPFPIGTPSQFTAVWTSSPSGTNVTITQGVLTINVSPTQTTNYILTLTNNLTHCVASDTVTVYCLADLLPQIRDSLHLRK